MSFDLDVWNGMTDAQRMKDMVRVIAERDAIAARLAAALEELGVARHRLRHFGKTTLSIDAFLADQPHDNSGNVIVQANLASTLTSHPFLSPTHACVDCGALWRQCDDFSMNLRSPSCCDACNNAPVGPQIRPLYVAPTTADQPSAPRTEPPYVDCQNCHACLRGKKDEYGFPATATRMIVCPECGNKRCPKASDHTLSCTGSNEPGQPGSIYPADKGAGQPPAEPDRLAEIRERAAQYRPIIRNRPEFLARGTTPCTVSDNVQAKLDRVTLLTYTDALAAEVERLRAEISSLISRTDKQATDAAVVVDNLRAERDEARLAIQKFMQVAFDTDIKHYGAMATPWPAIFRITDD